MADPRKPPPDIPPAVFRGGSWLLSVFDSRGYVLVGIWERAFVIPTGSARDWHQTFRVVEPLPANWSFATAQVVGWDMNYTARNIDEYSDHHLGHIGVGVGLTLESDRAVRLHVWDLLRDKNGDDRRRGEVRVRVLAYARLSNTSRLIVPDLPGELAPKAAPPEEQYEDRERREETREPGAARIAER